MDPESPQPGPAPAAARRAPVGPARHPLIRWLWLLLAWIALALGVLGLALPGLPTTPFVLLAAFAAARGSARLHRWLHRHPRFGPLIADWEREGAIGARPKRIAIALMLLAAAVLYVAAPAWWMAAIAWAIMLPAAIWIWLRPLPAAERRA